MPDTPSPKPANILMVLLDELFIPIWNPRKFIDPIELADLVAYIEKGGWVPRILLLKRAEGGWWVISGQRRVLAHRKLGKTYIEAEVMNISLEEAKIMAETSNEGPKPYWLDSYENWETLLAENPDWSQRGLADRLGKPKTLVQRASQITSLLNPASRALIRESLNSQKPLNFDGSDPVGVTDTENKGELWKLNSETVRKLIPLLTGREKADAQALAEKAVKLILDRRMTGPKAAELVKWINAGEAPEEFGSAKPTPKATHVSAPKPQAEEQALSTPIFHKQEMGANAPSAQVPAPTSTPAVHNPFQPIASAQTKVYMFRDWLAGVKVIPQLKHKVEKGQTLTLPEALVLGAYRIGQGLGWLWKEIFKPMLKPFLQAFKEAFGKLFHKIAVFAFTVIFLLVLVWAVWSLWLHHGFHPINWIESKFSHESSASEPTPVPTSPSTSLIIPTVPPTVRSSKLESSQLKTPHSNVVTYQPAVSFSTTASTLKPSSTLYDPKIIELEIAAIPQNSIVKDYPFTPDKTMPGDLATSRLQDLINSDKYTMKVGNDTQKIGAVSSSNNTLMITFKSSDLLGRLVDGTNQPTFFWEDVTTVHINQIEVETNTPSTLYQCSLIVSGSKNPLTIQCARPEDLEHLVSTMEYFIRSSRLAHDAQPAGLPYPNQGLVLSNDCRVEKLWADSPMDKAGLKLGDMIWSLDKNAGLQPERKSLETQLASLTPGPHNLFVVSPSDRDKGIIIMNQTHSSNFNPKRHKMILIVS